MVAGSVFAGCGGRADAPPAAPPLRVMSAVSPSSRKITRRVACRIAEVVDRAVSVIARC
jgi:hypothetical protein